MEKQLKSCLNIFHFFGVSLKSFSRQNSWRENFLSVCSIAMFTFYSVMAGLAPLITKAVGNSEMMTIFLIVCFWVFCLACYITLYSILKSKPMKKEFWKMTKELENVLALISGKENDYKNIRRFAIAKIFFTLSVSVLSPLILGIVGYVTGFKRAVSLGQLGYIPLFMYRVLLIEFGFYVDILAVFMRAIEEKMADVDIRNDEKILISKAYTLCWQMSQIIIKIFENGLVLSMMNTFFGALFCGYSMISDLSHSNIRPGPFIVTLSLIFGVFMIAEPCQKCLNASSAIASLVFNTKHINFFNNNEHLYKIEFALQVKNQRIVFVPKNLFTIDLKLVVNVSINKITLRGFMNINLYFQRCLH
jgi:hypothetical protein